MPPSGRKPWLGWAIVIGVAYMAVGDLSEVFSNWSGSNHVRAWRLAAWVVSGLLFVTHIAYEHFLPRNTPRSSALHVAIAVAIGAFLLALVALIHAAMVPVHAPYWLYAVALVAWPMITALPAFVVAFVVSSALKRFPARAAAPPPDVRYRLENQETELNKSS